MSLEDALRLSEIGLAWAIIQRGAEHLGTRDRLLFAGQIVASLLLLTGLVTAMALLMLWGLCVVQLSRFNGPYCGGADKMALLITTCLLMARLSVSPGITELAFAYLAVQLLLSYVVSGWVKLRNPAWREGEALADVFAFSAYPAAEAYRALGLRRRLLFCASWTVILLEVLFPLALFSQATLLAALALTAAFHLANAILLGLNRFFWIWIAAYPSLIWFQARLFG